MKELQEEHRRQTTELQQNYEDFKNLFSKLPTSTPNESFATNNVNDEKNVENDRTSATNSTSEEIDVSNPFFDAEEQLEESNPFKEESETLDQYDKSGKNPFA